MRVHLDAVYLTGKMMQERDNGEIETQKKVPQL